MLSHRARPRMPSRLLSGAATQRHHARRRTSSNSDASSGNSAACSWSLSHVCASGSEKGWALNVRAQQGRSASDAAHTHALMNADFDSPPSLHCWASRLLAPWSCPAVKGIRNRFLVVTCVAGETARSCRLPACRAAHARAARLRLIEPLSHQTDVCVIGSGLPPLRASRGLVKTSFTGAHKRAEFHVILEPAPLITRADVVMEVAVRNAGVRADDGVASDRDHVTCEHRWWWWQPSVGQAPLPDSGEGVWERSRCRCTLQRCGIYRVCRRAAHLATRSRQRRSRLVG